MLLGIAAESTCFRQEVLAVHIILPLTRTKCSTFSLITHSAGQLLNQPDPNPGTINVKNISTTANSNGVSNRMRKILLLLISCWVLRSFCCLAVQVPLVPRLEQKPSSYTRTLPSANVIPGPMYVVYKSSDTAFFGHCRPAAMCGEILFLLRCPCRV